MTKKCYYLHMDNQKNKKTLTELGNKLRTARERTKLTQAEVAAKAEINHNYYAVIERGEANPSYRKLQKILKVLNIKSLDID